MTPNQVDYYSVLDLSSDATAQAITARYQELSVAFNPDNFPAGRHRQMAEDRMKGVAAAFGVLSNPATRTAYDASRGGKPPPLAAKAGDRISANDNLEWPILPPRVRGRIWGSRLMHEGQDFNSQREYSGPRHASMKELAHAFIKNCKEANIPSTIQWSGDLAATDSQFSLFCYNGPLYGSDCHVMDIVVFSSLGETVTVHVTHQIVLTVTRWQMLKLTGIRLAVAGAFLGVSLLASFLPIYGELMIVLLGVLLVIQNTVDLVIYLPRLNKGLGNKIRQLTYALEHLEFYSFFLIFPGVVYAYAFFLAYTGELTRGVVLIGIGVTALQTILSILTTGCHPRDMLPGIAPWHHHNVVIRNAILQAVAKTISPRV